VTVAEVDASELQGLIEVFDGAEHQAAEKTYPAVKRHAEQLRDEWRSNARATAKQHGKLYPKTITASQTPIVDAIEWEVGPESALPQGGMGRGFEYGSVNQPPHLDGNRAATKIEPEFLKSLDDIVQGLL
jgi:hypothetical protein